MQHIFSNLMIGKVGQYKVSVFVVVSSIGFILHLYVVRIEFLLG